MWPNLKGWVFMPSNANDVTTPLSVQQNEKRKFFIANQANQGLNELQVRAQWLLFFYLFTQLFIMFSSFTSTKSNAVFLLVY